MQVSSHSAERESDARDICRPESPDIDAQIRAIRREHRICLSLLSKDVPATEFNMFTHLPAELRQQIWRYVFEREISQRKRVVPVAATLGLDAAWRLRILDPMADPWYPWSGKGGMVFQPTAMWMEARTVLMRFYKNITGPAEYQDQLWPEEDQVQAMDTSLIHGRMEPAIKGKDCQIGNNGKGHKRGKSRKPYIPFNPDHDILYFPSAADHPTISGIPISINVFSFLRLRGEWTPAFFQQVGAKFGGSDHSDQTPSPTAAASPKECLRWECLFTGFMPKWSLSELGGTWRDVRHIMIDSDVFMSATPSRDLRDFIAHWTCGYDEQNNRSVLNARSPESDEWSHTALEKITIRCNNPFLPTGDGVRQFERRDSGRAVHYSKGNAICLCVVRMPRNIKAVAMVWEGEEGQSQHQRIVEVSMHPSDWVNNRIPITYEQDYSFGQLKRFDVFLASKPEDLGGTDILFPLGRSGQFVSSRQFPDFVRAAVEAASEDDFHVFARSWLWAANWTLPPFMNPRTMRADELICSTVPHPNELSTWARMQDWARTQTKGTYFQRGRDGMLVTINARRLLLSIRALLLVMWILVVNILARPDMVLDVAHTIIKNNRVGVILWYWMNYYLDYADW